MLLLLLPVALAAGPADLQAVLDANLAKGRVDYAAIQATKALDAYLRWLETAPEPAGQQERMAFWINAYNALTIDLMADEWPQQSILDLDGGKVWDTRRFTVAGKQVSLNDIEHKILRPMWDPRVHAAINCASIGCPPISGRVFTSEGLSGQLDAASDNWMRTNGVRVDLAGKSATFNKIFDWYGDDFLASYDCGLGLGDPKLSAAACFASKHVPEAQAAFLKAGGFAASHHEYDWGVNKK